MKYYFIFLVLFLLGCDKVVSETSTKIGQQIGSHSCSTGPGYCMECGLNLTGGFDCLPKLKVSCTGSQDALFDIYEVKREYESGEVKVFNSKRFIKPLSGCK